MDLHIPKPDGIWETGPSWLFDGDEVTQRTILIPAEESVTPYSDQ